MLSQLGVLLLIASSCNAADVSLDVPLREQPQTIKAHVDSKFPGNVLTKETKYGEDGQTESVEVSFGGTDPAPMAGGEDMIATGQAPSPVGTYRPRECNEQAIHEQACYYATLNPVRTSSVFWPCYQASQQIPGAPMEFAAEGSGCKLNELARLGSVYSPNHVLTVQTEVHYSTASIEDKATKSTRQMMDSVKSGFGLEVGPFAFSLSSEEESSEESESERSSTEIVSEHTVLAFTHQMDPTMYGYLCVRADAGTPAGPGKIHGIMPASASSSTNNQQQQQGGQSQGQQQQGGQSQGQQQQGGSLKQAFLQRIGSGRVRGSRRAHRSGSGRPPTGAIQNQNQSLSSAPLRVADAPSEWDSVGCINVVDEQAIAPGTIDKIKAVAKSVAARLPADLVDKIVEAASNRKRAFTPEGNKAVLAALGDSKLRTLVLELINLLGSSVVTWVQMGGRLRQSMKTSNEQRSAAEAQSTMSSFGVQVEAQADEDLQGEIQETNIETVTTVHGLTTSVKTVTSESGSDTTEEDSGDNNAVAQASAGMGVSAGHSRSTSTSTSSSTSSSSDSSHVRVHTVGGPADAMTGNGGDELSPEGIRQWMQHVPGEAAPLETRGRHLAQMITIGKLDACHALQDHKYRGDLDDASVEAAEILQLLPQCLGSMDDPSITDKSKLIAVTHAVIALVWDAVEEANSKAGPVANIRMVALEMIQLTREGMVQNLADCEIVNAIIALSNEATSKADFLSKKVQPVDCEQAMAIQSDRIETPFTTDQVKLLSYEPKRGHMSDQCKTCLNYVNNHGLQNDNGTKGSPWTFGCDSRLEPEADTDLCDGMQQTLEKLGGGQGRNQRAATACALSPAEQSTFDYILKSVQSPDIIKLANKDTNLRVPGVVCTQAGACGYDETGMKRSLSFVRTKDATLDAIKTNAYIGGTGCESYSTEVVDNVASKVSKSSGFVVVPNNQVSLTVKADVVYRVANRRFGRCPAPHKFSEYSKDLSTTGVFGELGPAHSQIHAVFDFMRSDGQYIVQSNTQGEKKQGSAYLAQPMPANEGSLSFVKDGRVISKEPLSCSRKAGRRKYPRLEGLKLNTNYLSPDVLTISVSTGYAHSHGDKHVLTGNIYGDSPDSDIICIDIALSGDDAKLVKKTLFPKLSMLKEAEEAVDEKLQAANQKGLSAEDQDETLNMLEKAEQDLASVERAFKLFGDVYEVDRQNGMSISCNW